MRVEINENGKTKEEFPKLMISKDGFVILATKVIEGRMIGTLISKSPIGLHSDEWVESSFKPLEGSITLSND